MLLKGSLSEPPFEEPLKVFPLKEPFIGAPLNGTRKRTEEEAVGPAFWQPTIFSDSVCFEWLCVGFCVSWSLVWRACVHVFVSNYNIISELFQTRRSVL